MARKAIFITGGASGIGRAVALRFAQSGWFVGLADIDEGGLASTAALLPSGHSSCHRLDVRDRQGWDAALADFARGTGGRIDVV
ncbi:MAG: short-chain dehydrogenase, partial [Novosphingobium sp.]|nr:short-chain dehydrogenase [Novosphingobium sp.]